MNNTPTKADDSGDTLSADNFNPLNNELENVVTQTGQTLDPDKTVAGDQNQVGKALAAYGSSGDFYQDSGVADAYVLSRTGSLQNVPGPLNGLTATFKVGNTNTGASTVNWPGVGTKDITTTVGAALSGGELPVNQVIELRYNLSDDRAEFIGALVPFASQSQQEAGTSNTVAVTPGVQQFHPLALKAWVNFDGTGVVSITDDEGISSITDNGVGDYTINFSTAWADTNYCISGYARDNDDNIGDGTLSAKLSAAKTVNAMDVNTGNPSTGAFDSSEVCAHFTGRL